MFEELILNIINTTLNSFDIPFCVIVNIGTYLIIKTIIDIKGSNTISIWHKRLIFLSVSIIFGTIYCIDGCDYRTILNSIILAPVSWSWIFKPICTKLNIDYNIKIKEN